MRDCGMKALITTPEKLKALLPVLRDIPSLEFYVVTGEANGFGHERRVASQIDISI